MDAYCKEIRKLEAHVYGLEFHHILRDYNVVADVLSKLGSKWALVPAGIFVQALNSPTVKIEEEPPAKTDLAPALGQEVLAPIQIGEPRYSTSSSTTSPTRRTRSTSDSCDTSGV